MEGATWNEPAPGDLALVQRFVNSIDLDTQADELSDPDRMGFWLREAGLADDPAFDEDARRRLIDFREALRRLLLAHNGGGLDAETVAALDAAARDAHVHVVFGDDGAARLAPALGGAEGVLGRLLAIIARAEADGTWSRLKACSSESCRWAFYDRSRNRSRIWCTMTICGNRAKARSYRARQR
jgi:predicted RNA-binding Zn ribbon-like protein